MKGTIYCDGLCEPANPGGVATWAYVIYKDGKKVYSNKGVLGSGPGMTNSKAEYTAAIEALLQALKMGFTEIVLRSDSQLLIRQLQGIYRVRSLGLVPLYRKAKTLMMQISKMEIHKKGVFWEDPRNPELI